MDHTSININTSMMSCGVLELSRISDIDRAIYQLASRLYHPARGEPAAFVLASDVHNEKNNTDAFFEKMESLENLKTFDSPAAENPKTGNMIFVTVGIINHINFKKWYTKERIRRLKKAGS